MAFLRGNGTETSHLVVDDWDSFYNALRTSRASGSETDDTKYFAYYYDSNTDKYYYRLNGDVLPEGASWSTEVWGFVYYIELDPDSENKVIDCNNFSIGEHFLTNNGVSPLPLGNNNHDSKDSSANKTIYGNDWILKNFWFYGHIFFYDVAKLTVNKLHFLNCFHLVTDQSSDDSIFGNTGMTFNDCKFSILTTGGNSYSIIKKGSTGNQNYYIRMNRCSLNIINTSKEFNFFTNSVGSTSTSYTSASPHKFYNCNFRIKALNSGNFLDVEGTMSSSLSTFPSFYFCKFTCFFDKFRISDSQDSSKGGQRLGGNGTNSSKAKSMLTNCLFQIKFNTLYGGNYSDKNSYINDSTLGVVNIDYIDENKYRIKEDNTDYPNFPTIGMSKNDILNLNKITEKGFPVMSKIISDENEV